MKLLKRILAVMVMVVSVLLIILWAAGIVGNWMANKALTDATVQVLTGVDTVLGRTDEALTRLDSAVGNARDRVDAFDENVEAAGENFAVIERQHTIRKHESLLRVMSGLNNRIPLVDQRSYLGQHTDLITEIQICRRLV